VRTDARLAEYDFGTRDDLSPAELRARGSWEAVQGDPEFAPPLGEPFAANARRVAAALEEIAARHPAARRPPLRARQAGIAELALAARPRLIHLDPVIS
jgi:broad specificity phosphatase PhoE